LSDAQSHPNFAYRPETGEEIFHSLIGVPIVRGGRVIGVLVVQNKTSRNYTEEEAETLETVAMVLAELVGSGELVGRDELASVDGNALLPVRLEGTKLTGGVGVGVAVMHEPQIVVETLVAEDPDHEKVRLREAMQAMRVKLDEMFEAQDLAMGGEHRDLLETYRMFAEDAGWMARITEAINSGLTAEAAVQKVHEDTRVRMAQVTDPYLRERLHDFEDIANRLLGHLVGKEGGSASRGDLPENTVLVCRSLGPTELLDYDRKRLRALVLEEGSPTMHVAILARALDIPMIGRAHDALRRINNNDTVVVDADNAQIFVRPSDDILDAYAASQTIRAQKLAAYAAMRDLPAVTRCGQSVRMMINAGLLVDVPQLQVTGADGIGLYRTEMPFMSKPRMPDVADQTVLYSSILDQADGRAVVFRTLDVGSDKLLPYWHSEPEDNPALGWRSIRITLDRPAILRHQLRALLRAGSGRDMHIMFPMVAEVAEFDRLKAILALEQNHQAAQSGRDDGGAGFGLAASRLARPRRFPVDRQQRSGAVPVRRRSRKSAHFRPLRRAVAGHAQFSARHFPGGESQGRALVGVRRDGRTAARSHGAAGGGAARFVDVGAADRPGQGDGAIAILAGARDLYGRALRSGLPFGA